ncbi:hypothetical protein CEXT_353521 [Caerostris extrusa]|uniref:Uncharacterized protein n=1 Tax=Caerostris extrusa TaxID=172846 RepID=A0AAV4W7F9_CAEEX|nr:hypothetical protein CEXT_353521 [Caerostris extrusa]
MKLQILPNAIAPPVCLPHQLRVVVGRTAELAECQSRFPPDDSHKVHLQLKNLPKEQFPALPCSVTCLYAFKYLSWATGVGTPNMQCFQSLAVWAWNSAWSVSQVNVKIEKLLTFSLSHSHSISVQHLSEIVGRTLKAIS